MYFHFRRKRFFVIAGRITGLERVGENLAIAESTSYVYDGAVYQYNALNQLVSL
ncbi:MAG: hypothetical protein K2O16_14405 [Lachnospiraceae bacterium]|nr:hypothetical protein [Lachnospiraceae bacterium]